MATIAAPRIESSNSKLIAPWWHTALLIPSGMHRPPQSRWSNRYHLPGYNQLAR